MYRNKERLTEKSLDRQKVSVIMTVLNEAASIKTILENLLSQSRKPDEIVIVDGGSRDGTTELIRKASERKSSISHQWGTGEGGKTGGKGIGLYFRRRPFLS